MLVATKLVIFIESVGGNGHSSYEKLQCGLSMGSLWEGLRASQSILSYFYNEGAIDVPFFSQVSFLGTTIPVACL